MVSSPRKETRQMHFLLIMCCRESPGNPVPPSRLPNGWAAAEASRLGPGGPPLGEGNVGLRKDPAQDAYQGPPGLLRSSCSSRNRNPHLCTHGLDCPYLIGVIAPQGSSPSALRVPSTSQGLASWGERSEPKAAEWNPLRFFTSFWFMTFLYIHWSHSPFRIPGR